MEKPVTLGLGFLICFNDCHDEIPVELMVIFTPKEMEELVLLEYDSSPLFFFLAKPHFESSFHVL